jgi:hypothetical protein
MSSSPKDRASLCLFTFTDGRRCRTPRTTGHPHFCFYHARKESQARVAEKLGNDLNFFLSGEYLSANDLAVALGRIIPAVARGDIKPRTATTVAYLAQTLLQTIQVAQHEYINAFGTPNWRDTISNNVNQNWTYRNPTPPASPPSTPDPAADPAPPAADPATPNVGAGLQPGPTPANAPESSNSAPPANPTPPQPDESDPSPDPNVIDAADEAPEESEVHEDDELDEVHEEPEETHEPVGFVTMPTQHAGEDRSFVTNADQHQPHHSRP